MTQVELVQALIEVLDKANIPFMVVGSLSSNLYGIPRSTKDADFVVQLGDVSLSSIRPGLPPQLRMDPQMRFETVTATTCHRLYDRDSDFLIELFELSPDPHDVARFARRVKNTYGGKPVSAPTAEDVIVTKLRWSKNGRRSKDVDDVTAVLAVQQGKLDLSYIRGWCDRHGTRELFENLLAETPDLPD